MKYERKLVVFGNVDEDCIIDVSVNNCKVKSGLVKSGNNIEIYSFIDTVQRHGKLPVNLKVIAGSFTFTKVRVYYSAIIRSKTEFIIGNLLFDQPIVNPLYTFNKVTKSVNPIDYKLSAKTSIAFEHLFFNGPSYWNIDVDTIIDTIIDVGCIHVLEENGGVKISYPSYIEPIFLYENKPFKYNELIEDLYFS